MRQLALAAELRAQVSAWRRAGLSVGLVPTMGNLHAGHYALVEQARAQADRVVATVFVNPTQFGPNEDFARYPRTPDEDARGLQACGCDLMFVPSIDTVYPLGPDQAHRLSVPDLANVLCGAHRPGHFDGVVTVVSRLYNLVQPDLAVFGEKDFQQLRVLERMTWDLGYPIRILRGATVREADGLAMSSRNRYLDPDQRQMAPMLPGALQQVREQVLAGCPADQAEQQVTRSLQDAGFAVDYIEVRREDDLRCPEPGETAPCRVFGAVRLGSTRLIDNVSI